MIVGVNALIILIITLIRYGEDIIEVDGTYMNANGLSVDKDALLYKSLF
jgi:hypothetical protein